MTTKEAPRDRFDVRPPKFCRRCPAKWEPDDDVCWFCWCPQDVAGAVATNKPRVSVRQEMMN